jgi:hypothetical protein
MFFTVEPDQETSIRLPERGRQVVTEHAQPEEFTHAH